MFQWVCEYIYIYIYICIYIYIYIYGKFRTVFHLTPGITFGYHTSYHLWYRPLLNERARKYGKEVNNADSIQRYSDKINRSGRRRNVNWYIKIYENVEIAFMCGVHNVVVYKFDPDVSSRTDRWRKSHWQNNRPTPCIAFSKHPVFHIPYVYIYGYPNWSAFFAAVYI